LKLENPYANVPKEQKQRENDKRPNHYLKLSSKSNVKNDKRPNQ
jgi:hypothetical protein